MARRPIQRDHRGEMVDFSRLTEEEGAATVTGVRQAMPEHPSWGLSPDGLANILRDSEGTDPSRFYALLADVQEREWHYRGVLFQRRAALAQLPITVDPYSDSAAHVDQADFIRRLVTLPDFTHSRFELGDALDKGMGFGELIWETSERQWMPKAIKLRPPTWFRYDRIDLETPFLLDPQGQAQSLTPYKWIVHRARLNSGIPIRDGLGRSAVWAWMFKNFDIKAWSMFLARYGLPIRIGTFPTGATTAEKSQLLRALRNIGSDAAAIVPQGMEIRFEKAGDGSSGGAAFKDQAVYFDEQLSKLVLGQTGTSDASKGGYAVGRVHEGVRDAIASYDGLVQAMTLNRDLVLPAIALNYGPQEGYPTIKIGLGDMRNVELIMKHLGTMIDRGLKVEASQIYPMFGLTEPAEGKDVVLLQPSATPNTPSQPDEEAGEPPPSPDGVRADPRGDGGAPSRKTARLSAEPQAVATERDAVQIAAEEAADPVLLSELRRQIEEALEQSTSFEEFQARLEGLVRGPVDEKMVNKLAAYLFNARLAGELGAPLSKTD